MPARPTQLPNSPMNPLIRQAMFASRSDRRRADPEAPQTMTPPEPRTAYPNAACYNRSVPTRGTHPSTLSSASLQPSIPSSWYDHVIVESQAPTRASTVGASFAHTCSRHSPNQYRRPPV